MVWKIVKNVSEFEKLEKEHKDFLVTMFVTKSSTATVPAMKRLKEASAENKEVAACVVDAHEVQGIHTRFGVNSVPTLVVLKDGKPVRKIMGLQSREYYEMVLGDIAPETISSSGKEEKPRRKSVTVYTSPTCTWCNALKTYLRQNRVHFREIDVSRNQRAAEELVRRSGQMGVPQTLIDGKIIVGFDKARINQALGLKAHAG